MDGSILDHSDSESGDSWTILDHSPAGDEAQVVADHNQLLDRYSDKDEDTDGISIISDSEPESSSPCDMIPDNFMSEELTPPVTLQEQQQFVSINSLDSDKNLEESIRTDDDFLGVNTVKHKTYVHRRNKRLSTVLNIIMLGSVITAAGVAIGHMWGARNECTVHTAPSINKILSNLYKLQEENTYLRNKITELTLINNLQTQHKKLGTTNKPSFKQQRCKKIYEGPLNSKDTNKVAKCIDTEINNNADDNNNLLQPEFEKEFLRDVDKLKQIYQQNRSWLDGEVAKRMKHEEETITKMVKTPLSSISEEQKVWQDDSTKKLFDLNNNQHFHISPDTEELIQFELNSKNVGDIPSMPIKKITYADSLKSDQLQNMQLESINSKTEGFKMTSLEIKPEPKIKKRMKKDKDIIINDGNISEDELKKDDRYTTGRKRKQEKKKHDRQKLHKKQKRRNKYEQWEMKGGYMKDYDDFSIHSFKDNENSIYKKIDSKLSQDFEKIYNNQFLDTESTQNNSPYKLQNKKVEKAIGKNAKGEDANNWYDKRAVLRTEARKKLEHELFGETSPNNAGWYFRRMQKREQCRAKSDNSTYKKLYKRNMNFKMKR